MLGFKDYKGNVLDSFSQVMEEQAGEKIGAIKFTRKDRTSIAILYVKVGAVYGIELSTYKPNIVSRLVSSPNLAEAHRDQILEKYGNPDQLDDYSVVEYILTRHMLPEVEVMRVLREHFLDSFDEVGSWDEVHTEWKPGQEPPAGIIVIPSLPWTGLLERWRRRQNHLNSVLVPEWGIPAHQIGDLLIHAEQEEIPADLKPDAVLLYSAVAASPEVLSVGQLATWLGMSRFSTKLGLFELWSRQLVTVSREGGPTITANPNPPVEEVEEVAPNDIETVLDGEVADMHHELTESLQSETFQEETTEPEIATVYPADSAVVPPVVEQHPEEEEEEPVFQAENVEEVAPVEEVEPVPDATSADLPAMPTLLGTDIGVLAQQVRAQYELLADRKRSLEQAHQDLDQKRADLSARAEEAEQHAQVAEQSRVAELEAAQLRLTEINAQLETLHQEQGKVQDSVDRLSQPGHTQAEQKHLAIQLAEVEREEQALKAQVVETDAAVKSLQDLFRL